MIYTNSQGNSINLNSDPYWLDCEAIRNYEWEYATKDKKRGHIIAGFTKDVKELDLELDIWGLTEEQKNRNIDAFNNLIEIDIYNGVAGTLSDGDWFTYGYFIASENTDWNKGAPMVRKKVTFVREKLSWYHITRAANFGADSDEQLFVFNEEDIKTYEGEDTNLLKSLTSTINPKQAGSGDPSPDNVRPISGWDSVNVTRNGKNLLKPFETQTLNGITLTNNDGVITLNGTATATATFAVEFSNPIPAGDYYWSLNNKNSNANVTMFLITVKGTGNPSINGATINAGKVVTIADGENHDLWINKARLRVTSGTTLSDFVLSPQLEHGTTATSYEPYQGQTYTTDLPETVYGGTLDIVNGVLTIDRAMVTYDGSSDENWAGANTRFAIVPDGVYKSGTGRGEVLSNEFVYSSSATTVGTIFLLQSSGQVYVYPPASDSLANFKSWLSSNPLQIVYPLAEPRTIQLTPKQVTTLLGENNVWSDSGEVTVEYWDDAGRIKTASGSIVTFSKYNALSGTGYDYSYNYMTDVQSQKTITNPGSVPCDFIINIQGYVDHPILKIGDNIVSVDVEVPYGAHLTIDSTKKTVIMTLIDGTEINCFGARDPDYYLFERIPYGRNVVTWNGSFIWELKLIEERSEPRWHTV